MAFQGKTLTKAGTLYNPKQRNKGSLVQLPPQPGLMLRWKEKGHGKERAIHESGEQRVCSGVSLQAWPEQQSSFTLRKGGLLGTGT